MTNLPVTGIFNVTAIFGQKGKYWKNGHKGVDITCSNKSIYATCNGVVRVVGWDPNGWGRYVTVGDSNGDVHIFCHLIKDSVRVKTGDKVNRATVLGTMGTTGNSSGVHLHYQINRNGTPINPCNHLGIPNKKGEYDSDDFHISPFEDVMTDHWAYDSIKKLHDKGIVSGYTDGTYRPSNVITRAEAAAIIYESCKKLTSIDLSKYYTKTFVDVPKTHWAFNQITVIHNLGIVNGYSNGKFKPDSKISRAEIAVMIRQLLDIVNKVDVRWLKEFTDVPKNHWGYYFINDIYNLGIVSGTSSGIFSPKNLVTRAEMAVMINNVFTYYKK